MKKRSTKTKNDTMRREYAFSKGVRGKYAKRYAEGTNIVILSPDVAQSFPDSESVNEASRVLVKVSRRGVKKAPA